MYTLVFPLSFPPSSFLLSYRFLVDSSPRSFLLGRYTSHQANLDESQSPLETNGNNQTPSTKCQYHAAASKPTWSFRLRGIFTNIASSYMANISPSLGLALFLSVWSTLECRGSLRFPLLDHFWELTPPLHEKRRYQGSASRLGDRAHNNVLVDWKQAYAGVSEDLPSPPLLEGMGLTGPADSLHGYLVPGEQRG